MSVTTATPAIDTAPPAFNQQTASRGWSQAGLGRAARPVAAPPSTSGHRFGGLTGPTSSLAMPLAGSLPAPRPGMVQRLGRNETPGRVGTSGRIITPGGFTTSGRIVTPGAPSAVQRAPLVSGPAGRTTSTRSGSNAQPKVFGSAPAIIIPRPHPYGLAIQRGIFGDIFKGISSVAGPLMKGISSVAGPLMKGLGGGKGGSLMKAAGPLLGSMMGGQGGGTPGTQGGGPMQSLLQNVMGGGNSAQGAGAEGAGGAAEGATAEAAGGAGEGMAGGLMDLLPMLL